MSVREARSLGANFTLAVDLVQRGIAVQSVTDRLQLLHALDAGDGGIELHAFGTELEFQAKLDGNQQALGFASCRPSLMPFSSPAFSPRS